MKRKLTVADMLEYVYQDPKELMKRYREQIEHSDASCLAGYVFLKRTPKRGLNGYKSYLEDE